MSTFHRDFKVSLGWVSVSKRPPNQPTKQTEVISESNQRPGRKEVQRGSERSKTEKQKKNSKDWSQFQEGYLFSLVIIDINNRLHIKALSLGFNFIFC